MGAPLVINKAMDFFSGLLSFALLIHAVDMVETNRFWFCNGYFRSHCYIQWAKYVLQLGVMGASVSNQQAQVLQWDIMGISNGPQVLHESNMGASVSSQRAHGFP